MQPIESVNQIAATPYGKLIYNPHDEETGRSIAIYAEYGEFETVVYNQIVNPGQFVVEVGGGIGVHSLFLARKLGPTGRVFAFEPKRLLFQLLCGNMALNGITNVHCWNMAVGAETGEVEVPVESDAAESQSLESSERVPRVTVDGLGLPRVDFLRVAQPGAEDAVVRGAAETIERYRPTVYFSRPAEAGVPSLIRLLDGLGYSMYWHRTPLFNPDNFAGNRNNVFGDAAESNLLCLDKAASKQLTGFTPVDVPEAA